MLYSYITYDCNKGRQYACNFVDCKLVLLNNLSKCYNVAKMDENKIQIQLKCLFLTFRMEIMFLCNESPELNESSHIHSYVSSTHLLWVSLKYVEWCIGLTTLSRMSENVGASTSCNPKGIHGLYRENFTVLLFFLFFLKHLFVSHLVHIA
jgi:hypothetical protein